MSNCIDASNTPIMLGIRTIRSCATIPPYRAHANDVSQAANDVKKGIERVDRSCSTICNVAKGEPYTNIASNIAIIPTKSVKPNTHSNNAHMMITALIV